MKLCQQVRISLALLGFRPNQSPFNKTQLWIFFKISTNLFSLCVYLAREPNTTKEYMDSIFMTTVIFLINVVRASTLFKNDIIFRYIDSVEETLNESEYTVR